MNVLAAYLRLLLLRRRLHRPIAELESIQAQRVRGLLQHAYAHVPYYRELLRQAGVQPRDIRSAKDIRHIPVTPQSVLRSIPNDAITARNLDPARCERRRTSGSQSGNPFHVLVSREEAAERALVTIRADMENGYRLWHRQGFVQRPSFREDTWFKRIGILKSLYVSVFDDLRSQVERLRSFRPVRLAGTPSALERVARYVVEEKISDLRPRLICTLGERLLPDLRALLERALAGEVFDRYGATESGILGWECARHEGYHLNADQCVVECTHGDDPAPAGEAGAVALTNLCSYVRPLIRVAVGDVAQLATKPCRCGCAFPVLARVLGRDDEFLHLSSGRWIGPGEVEATFAGLDGLSSFQLVQEGPGLFRLRVVASDRGLSSARSRARGIVGEEAELRVERTAEIPLTASGKVRRVVNLTAHAHG
jgi:phenylacetate-CoA ligase